MKNYFYIGIGGFFGAVSRYLIKEIPLSNSVNTFPLHTFMVNITGSFILAFFLILALNKYSQLDPSIRLGVTTGFLGAYTTFSTLCKETVFLLKGGYIVPAVSYMAASTVGGLGVTYLAVVLADKLSNTNKQDNHTAASLSEPDGEVD